MLLDFFIDLFAVCLGVLFILLLLRVIRKQCKKRKKSVSIEEVCEFEAFKSR